MNRFIVFLVAVLSCGAGWCQEGFDRAVTDQFQGHLFEITGDGHRPCAGFEVRNESGDVRITDDAGYFRIPFGESGNDFESLKLFREGYLFSSKAFPSEVRYWQFTCQKENPDTVTIGSAGGTAGASNPLPDVYGKAGGLQEIRFDFPAGALDREYTFCPTPYGNLCGYNLGAGTCTNRFGADRPSSFCHVACGGIAIHAVGEDPELPIAVAAPGTITIPAPASFDPDDSEGESAAGYAMLSYDHDLKDWTANGEIAFLPGAWAFEWTGFSHLSDHVIVRKHGLTMHKQPIRSVAGGAPLTRTTYVGGEVEFLQALRKLGYADPEHTLDNLHDADGRSVCVKPLVFHDKVSGTTSDCILIPANTGISVEVTAATSETRGNYVEENVRATLGTSSLNPIAKVESQFENISGASTERTRELSVKRCTSFAPVDRQTVVNVFVIYELLWETIVHDSGYVSEGLEARANGLGCYRVDCTGAHLNDPQVDLDTPGGLPGARPSTPGSSNPPGGPGTHGSGGGGTVKESGKGGREVVEKGSKTEKDQ